MSETQKAGYFSGLPEREKVKVNLPSGRSVTVLETTGREEKILSRIQDRTKLYETIAAYLAGVTENLDDVEGPVPASKFDDMLVGDRVYILLQARLLTHGPIIRHKHSCTGCDQTNEHEVDLKEIIDTTKPYPNGDQREFSVTLGDGILNYELPNGRTEAKLAREKNTDVNSKLKFMRIWEVTKSGNFPVSVDGLKSKHISTLRQSLRENECMIDTLAELHCPSCGKVSHVDIMGMADFLFPSAM